MRKRVGARGEIRIHYLSIMSRWLIPGLSFPSYSVTDKEIIPRKLLRGYSLLLFLSISQINYLITLTSNLVTIALTIAARHWKTSAIATISPAAALPASPQILVFQILVFSSLAMVLSRLTDARTRVTFWIFLWLFET